MTLKGKKVLVTGAAGFIGTNFILKLLRGGVKVRGVWHRKPSCIEHENFESVQADLTKRDDCYRVMEGIDYVIMAAAYVGGAEKMLLKPLDFVTDTTVINLYTLEAAYKNKVKKVLYISSGMVYPESMEPLVEEMGMEGVPFHKYYFGGWSRRYSEIVCRMYAEKLTEKMEIVVVRVDNIYGPHDSFAWEKSHVVAATVRKVVERMDPLEVWGGWKRLQGFYICGGFG